MPTIIDSLPYYDHESTVRIPAGPAIRILHRQIILWVSVTPAPVMNLPSDAKRFPAVFDVGFNDNFLLQENHLRDWAGVDPGSLVATDRLKVYGISVPVREANVWIHANVAGFRDRLQSSSFCLELNRGIAVCPDAVGHPRLPLLGLRALERSRVQVMLDTEQRTLSVHAKP